MAKNITQITVAQTFQNWFDKTNEMVGLFQNSTLTAAPGNGDQTDGNAILNGDFTAENLIGTEAISSDLFSSRTPGSSAAFDVPVEITAATDQLCATFTYSSGGAQTRYTDTTVGWDVGIEDSVTRKFIINTGTGTTKFELSTGGTLTVPNFVTTESIEVGTDLSVDGDSRFDGVVTFRGNVDMSEANLTANNVFATGEVVTNYSTSDIRLKENIEKIEYPLEKVNAISGYTFNYIDNPDERATGVIAQEIEQILPGLVYEFDKDGESTKAVRYGHIVALLIEAVKELDAEVKRLKDASTD